MTGTPATGADVVICAPLRTPVGRYGGALSTVSAAELAATVIRGLLDRTGIDPGAIDDVLLGQCYPNGEAPAIGRVAALDAGLPTTVGGLQLDRRCGSGVQALLYAVAQVQTGFNDVVLAGGVESMSQAEYYSTALRWGARAENSTMHDRLARGRVTAGGTQYPVPGGMIETAENLRRQYGISRAEQDAFSVRSHQRAVAAQDAGSFRDEIVPVEVRSRGTVIVVDTDEHPRRGVTTESLAALRPLRSGADPSSTVTAGNASGQNDAASIALVTTRNRAEALGIRPMGKVVSAAVAGVPPATMGIGPVPATERALARAGLGLADMDLVELNEAFAAQVLACTREWAWGDADMERLNVCGSGISLGHPVGATGGRIVATLLHEMHRRESRFALETLCIGGGQGISVVLERVSA